MPGVPRILIVEDEPVLARDISKRVRRFGFECCAVTGFGEDAIILADRERPDLVLMDIRLKGPMNGIVAAEHIRATLRIPVVYLTTFADGETFEAAKITEPYGYVLKPIHERELQMVLEMALYRHGAEIERNHLKAAARRAQKLNAVGEIAIEAARDLDVALQITLASCTALRHTLAPEHSAHKHLTIIEAATTRAEQIAHPLFVIGRKEDAQKPIVLDVASVLSSVKDRLSYVLGDRTTLAISSHGGPYAVLAHPSQLGHIFFRLAINARDGGSTALAIDVRFGGHSSAYVLLTVTEQFAEDRGPLMDEAARRLNGVSAVVSRLGGQLYAAHDAGRYRLTIWLPRSADPVHSTQPEPEPDALAVLLRGSAKS